ncbi:putative transposase [Escherichia coli MP021552.8]|nr:putative transposase [Escherichia coli MP021552.8]
MELARHLEFTVSTGVKVYFLRSSEYLGSGEQMRTQMG